MNIYGLFMPAGVISPVAITDETAEGREVHALGSGRRADADAFLIA